ncbi:MAG: tol-pal system protein YbgF [Rhodobacteraceae bacterium]|nr:tol-pal system protein YbgF [Paracoccaceae bacterium]
MIVAGDPWRILVIGLAAIAVLIAPAAVRMDRAVAQNEWVNPDVNALRGEVQRLQTEISAMRGGAGGGGIDTDSYVRLERIEGELRSLVGRLEQLEFAQRRSEQQVAATIESLGYRLDAVEQGLGIEGGGVGAPPLGAANPVGPAPTGGANYGGEQPYNATGGQALDQPQNAPPIPGVSAPGLDGGVAVGADGSILGAAPGLAPGTGAPPGVLGQINTDPALGPQPVQAGNADVAFSEAVSRVRAGAFEDAERQLRGFVDQHPQDQRVGDAKYWIGETHFVRGQYAEAARVFLDAYRQHPSSTRAPDSLLKLGMTLAQLNQRDEACLTFREVSARYPNAPPTVRQRAALEAERAGCP